MPASVNLLRPNLQPNRPQMQDAFPNYRIASLNTKRQDLDFLFPHSSNRLTFSVLTLYQHPFICGCRRGFKSRVLHYLIAKLSLEPWFICNRWQNNNKKKTELCCPVAVSCYMLSFFFTRFNGQCFVCSSTVCME